NTPGRTGLSDRVSVSLNSGFPSTSSKMFQLNTMGVGPMSPVETPTKLDASTADNGIESSQFAKSMVAGNVSSVGSMKLRQASVEPPTAFWVHVWSALASGGASRQVSIARAKQVRNVDRLILF